MNDRDQEFSTLVDQHEKLIAKLARLEAILECARACLEKCEYSSIRAILRITEERK